VPLCQLGPIIVIWFGGYGVDQGRRIRGAGDGAGEKLLAQLSQKAKEVERVLNVDWWRLAVGWFIFVGSSGHWIASVWFGLEPGECVSTRSACLRR
jgi:hypothetical protein